jgi:hypothetical protein
VCRAASRESCMLGAGLARATRCAWPLASDVIATSARAPHLLHADHVRPELLHLPDDGAAAVVPRQVGVGHLCIQKVAVLRSVLVCMGRVWRAMVGGRLGVLGVATPVEGTVGAAAVGDPQILRGGDGVTDAACAPAKML